MHVAEAGPLQGNPAPEVSGHAQEQLEAECSEFIVLPGSPVCPFFSGWLGAVFHRAEHGRKTGLGREQSSEVMDRGHQAGQGQEWRQKQWTAGEGAAKSMESVPEKK